MNQMRIKEHVAGYLGGALCSRRSASSLRAHHWVIIATACCTFSLLPKARWTGDSLKRSKNASTCAEKVFKLVQALAWDDLEQEIPR
jgi:hypothetical protein